MSTVMALGRLGPEEAAERIFRTYKDEDARLDAFTESLDRQRAGRSFAPHDHGVGSEPGRGGPVSSA